MTSAHLSRAALGGIVAAICLAPAAHATVTISSASTSNMSCTSGVCSPTAANAVLNVGDLTTMLASGNVTVNTGTGALAKQARSIDVSAGFTWASANSLTLDAYQSIAFKKQVSVAGAGAVMLKTNNGGKNGTLSFRPKASLSFLSTGNSLTIDGKPYTLVSTLSSLSADIAGNPSGNYALSANYDAKPDGAYATAPIATTFEGIFNGLGNTISHLKISANAKGLYLGLFGDVGKSGIVNSIRVMDTNISAKANSYVGVLAGLNYGFINGSFAEGSIQTKSGNIGVEAGGLVGANVGGLNGTSAATSILASGNSPISGATLGGLVGDNVGTIEMSYATGSAEAKNGVEWALSGGLVGFNNGTISDCYATGAATVQTYTAVEGAAGGLVGQNDLTINASYSTGVPSSRGAPVGGSIGLDGSDGADLTDVYWDTTTSGITNLSQGAGNIANDPGITGETTAQLQAALPSGFDPTIWAENPSINGGLPYLIANPPQ